MAKQTAFCFAAILACTLALSTSVRAQTASATLTGTIVDESEAVVPDVRITVLNLATGLQRSIVGDATGTFVVSFLPPGRYRVNAQHAGFAITEIPDVILNVGDAVGVKVLLRVAGVDTSISVTAAAPLISTSPAVGTVVDRQFVENLPLNGRSFQSLIAMTPGVVLTPATSTSPGQFSVNGQRSDANYVMVDGVSANVAVQSGTAFGVQAGGATPVLSAQGGTNNLVSVDAMQEFRIETSTYAPEFGRQPGGQIAIVTRSGTNQYHGTLFEYFRDDALDSTDYFVTRQGLAKPKERQHDFGGVFGGPITRDRMFVFVSYEHLQLDQPRSAITEVPSLASRAAASDALRPMFAAFPVPNGPETARGFAQYSASFSDPSRLNATSVRVDRTFGTAFTAFGRYNYAPSDGHSRLGSFGITSANTVGGLKNRLHTLTGGTTWIVNPTVSNDLRVNWSSSFGWNFQNIDAFGGAVVPPASTLHPAFAPTPNSYQFNLSGTNATVADSFNAANTQRQINIVDAVLLTRARHQIKLGVDYRHFLPTYGPAKFVQVYTFNGASGALAGTASTISLSATSIANRSPHATNVSAYAQDTWSVSPPLTLAYGVRWDVNPAPGLPATAGALALASGDPAAISLAPAGSRLYRTTFNNVAPRLGASYRLGERPARETVLRAGWGVFFDLGTGPVMDNFTSFPFTARRILTNAVFPADPASLTPPTIAPGAPADFLVASDPHLELPYTYEWNVAAEQAIGSSNAISVSYLGAAGHRLLRQQRLINPSPQIQQLTLITNEAHSTYDALQVKFTHRLARGIQALASYTLAKSIDNSSNDTVPALPSVRVDPEVDWGPSDFDVRHTFSGAVTYALPAVSGASVLSRIASGWSIDAIVTTHSSLPVNVVTGTTAFGISNALRPDIVANVPFYVDDDTVPGGWRFNRAAFIAPPLDASGNPLRQGTLGRNALRGFAMSQVDLAVRRDIRIASANLQLRVEAFNLFDRVSFGSPTNILSSGLFGQATRTLASSLGAGGIAGGGFSPLYQVGGPRSIQLALRLQF